MTLGIITDPMQPEKIARLAAGISKELCQQKVQSSFAASVFHMDSLAIPRDAG